MADYQPHGARDALAGAGVLRRRSPGPAAARRSIQFGSSATGAFLKKPCWPASLPTPATPMTGLHRARLQLALEHGLLRRCAHRARDSEKGIILNVSSGRGPHPRDQLQRPQRRLPVRCARPLQEGKSRPLGREQVRPDQDQTGRDRPQDILSEHGHQFATIKTEVKTIPPASVQVNFNIKEGPL